MQWGLVRRRWLRLRGEDDLTLWPWIATMIGGLAILNPFGLDVIGQAITYTPTNWLRDVVRTIALSGMAALTRHGVPGIPISGAGCCAGGWRKPAGAPASRFASFALHSPPAN